MQKKRIDMRVIILVLLLGLMGILGILYYFDIYKKKTVRSFMPIEYNYQLVSHS